MKVYKVLELVTTVRIPAAPSCRHHHHHYHRLHLPLLLLVQGSYPFYGTTMAAPSPPHMREVLHCWSSSVKNGKIPRLNTLGFCQGLFLGCIHSTSREITCVYNFPLCFLRTKINIFYFVNGLHHPLNHNLNLKIIYFPSLVQIYCVFLCVFIKFFKFPVFPCLEKLITKSTVFSVLWPPVKER